METKKSKELIVSKNDHAQLMHYLRTNTPELQYEKTRTGQLIEEFGRARVINNTDFPPDVVRLNSKVIIRNTLARQNYRYTIVLPGKVDFQSEKVSVLGPIGISLLGARKGDTISLSSPKGKIHFTILEVTNPID